LEQELVMVALAAVALAIVAFERAIRELTTAQRLRRRRSA
jgi:hypothetical protein